MKITFVVVFILLITIVVVSCSKKNHPGKTAVTYSSNVKEIIQAKCTPCHVPAVNGKKKPLDNYIAVKDNIDDIIRRIQLASTEKGYMPFKKDPLPAAEIEAFKKWKDTGMGE